jgi:Zn-dependent M28 family amino/carboxypeptidase
MKPLFPKLLTGGVTLTWLACVPVIVNNATSAERPATQVPATTLSAEDQKLDRAIAAHITFLADDLLEGRGTGTPGYDIAANYVAAQFQQLGLRPGGLSNTWFQSVPLLESTLVQDRVRFELRSGTETNVMEYNLDYLARPNPLGTNVTVTAPLMFVGYGVRAPELGYDDLPNVDLKGKIAVVLSKAPPRFPATALAHHAHARQKAKALVERGAIGIMTVPTPKDLEEAPWPRMLVQSRFPAMRWLHTDGTPADVFPELKASLSISPQGAGKLFARAPKSLQDALATAAKSEPQSFPLNVDATIVTVSEERRLSSPNVIGILPGSDPGLGQESVVFTAHLDHQGRGPASNGDSIYNGAFDNAIGISMMLEVARAFANDGKRPRRTLVFAAVTAEEKGLLGSEFLAQHLPHSLGKPVANLNLDMVLVTAPTRSYTILGIEHSTLRAPVESAAKRFELELLPDPQPERVIFIRSDQYSFIRQGVPAIFPKVDSNPKAPQPVSGISPETFIKEHYHRPSDDLSLPRDSASSVRFVRFMTDVARQIADANEPPRWNPGDFFGQTFGQAGRQ